MRISLYFLPLFIALFFFAVAKKLFPHIAIFFQLLISIILAAIFNLFLWFIFQKPKPKLKIIRYEALQITFPIKNKEKAVLSYSVHPLIYNEGTLATTILSIIVNLDNGKWVGEHKPFSDERNFGAGETKLIQLFSNLIDKNISIPTSSLPKEMKCKLIIYYTGRRRPLIDKRVIKLPI
jgi:hypothetical protein